MGLKILFYNHTGKISGAERVLLMILNEGAADVDPVVLCPTDGPLPDVVKERAIRTVSIDPLAARFTWRPDRLLRYLFSFMRVIKSVRSLVLAESPDLIHANSIRAGLVMAAATFGLGIPILWHVHDLVPPHPLSTAIRLVACASRRNHIIAVSEAVATRFRGRLLKWFSSRAPVVTILNGIDFTHFYPDVESRAETRKALGFDETRLIVGIVGQLTARKGQLEAIEAFGMVADEIPNAALLVVGEPLFNHDHEYQARLIQAASAPRLAGRIHFLGSREDVPALMRAFDLLLLNSRSEPFGLTVVEGMASETAVLAVAVDGVPEIIRHGKSGWLVTPDDSTKLAEGLCLLLQDSQLRRNLGRQSRLDTIERFSSQRFLREMNSLYRLLLPHGEMPQALCQKPSLQKPLRTEN
jgi:glycosyltransferase involved in cell wall biosynthesis